MNEPMKVYVVVVDCGLNGADATSVHTSEEAARATIAEVNRCWGSTTGYGGCEVVELVLDKPPELVRYG